MKKITSILLVVLIISALFAFTSCNRTYSSEITCEEIIKAYEEAGYYALYHDHENDEIYNDLGMYCCFEIRDPNNEDNYMYVHRYFNEEDAKVACKESQFNPILWLFFGIFGEWRWLHVKCYGNIVYETFDYKMLFPMYKLILQ